MKYAQLIIGLLAGTAIGAAVVSANGSGIGGSINRDEVKQIVRDTINEDPQFVLDAVQKYQQAKRQQDVDNASATLKQPDVQKQLYKFEDVAYVGPKDAKKVIVEFFDYDCPACHMMFKGVDELLKTNKDVKVIFREFPIFGPVSDQNSRLGIALARLYPEKYFAFHEKMMSGPGHNGSEAKTLGVIKALGLNADKVKAEAAKPDVQATLDATRKLAEALHIQGTPSLVIGDELIPHAMGPDELKAKVDALPH